MTSKAPKWKPAFGQFWSPRDWRILQALKLMKCSLTSAQAQAIVWAYRGMVESAAMRGFFAGWISALALLCALGWKP